MRPDEWIEGAYDEKLSRKNIIDLVYKHKSIAVHCNTYRKAIRFMAFTKGFAFLDPQFIDTGIYEYGKDLCLRIDDDSQHAVCSSVKICNEKNIPIIEYDEIDVEEILWRKIGAE